MDDDPNILDGRAHVAAAGVLACWFRLDFAKWVIGRLDAVGECGPRSSRLVACCVTGAAELDHLYSGPRAMLVIGHLQRAVSLGRRYDENGDWGRVLEALDLIDQEYVGAVSRLFWQSKVDALCARCEMRRSCGVFLAKLEGEVVVPPERFSVSAKRSGSVADGR